jgi:hypothetical protein
MREIARYRRLQVERGPQQMSHQTVVLVLFFLVAGDYIFEVLTFFGYIDIYVSIYKHNISYMLHLKRLKRHYLPNDTKF